MSANGNGPQSRATTEGRNNSLDGGSEHTITRPTVIAHARAERARHSGGHYWVLIIDSCPLCGKQHTHGGGDQLRPQYGHRTAHCTGRPPGSGYWLEPTPGEAP